MPTRSPTALLREAIRRGSLAQMRQALAQGADLEAPNRKRGQTVLHLAVGAGRLAMVQSLIAAGSNVNAQDDEGASPLFLSAGQPGDDTAIMEALIAAGADVFLADVEDGSPLVEATSNGCPRKVAVLMQAGAAVHDPQNRQSALFTMAFNDDANPMELEILRLLVASCTELNAATDTGWTALMAAAQMNGSASIRALIEAGADIHAKDDRGRTARSIALEYGSSGALAVIDAHLDRIALRSVVDTTLPVARPTTRRHM
jgi:ankyrin repeat protein